MRPRLLLAQSPCSAVIDDGEFELARTVERVVPRQDAALAGDDLQQLPRLPGGVLKRSQAATASTRRCWRNAQTPTHAVGPLAMEN
jgi:hypothetical protein